MNPWMHACINHLGIKRQLKRQPSGPGGIQINLPDVYTKTATTQAIYAIFPAQHAGTVLSSAWTPALSWFHKLCPWAAPCGCSRSRPWPLKSSSYFANLKVTVVMVALPSLADSYTHAALLVSYSKHFSWTLLGRLQSQTASQRFIFL